MNGLDEHITGNYGEDQQGRDDDLWDDDDDDQPNGVEDWLRQLLGTSRLAVRVG